MKKRVLNVITVLLFVAGICILSYPSFSDWWNSRTQSIMISEYESAVSNLSEQNYADMLRQAQLYNMELSKIGSANVFHDLDSVSISYDDILDVTETGIIGYITIAKLDTKLPIYHGTDDDVMQVGVGHLEGSSFPIGGESTHSVLVAHRGLPTAALFTDLNKMEEGDTFVINVLNETYVYEVDQIVTVLPDELDDIYITEGCDYCTLMTCTPYGINTHRLLVRGKRVENPEDEKAISEESENILYGKSVRHMILLCCASSLALVLIAILVRSRKHNNKKRGNYDE